MRKFKVLFYRSGELTYDLDVEGLNESVALAKALSLLDKNTWCLEDGDRITIESLT